MAEPSRLASDELPLDTSSPPTATPLHENSDGRNSAQRHQTWTMCKWCGKGWCPTHELDLYAKCKSCGIPFCRQEAGPEGQERRDPNMNEESAWQPLCLDAVDIATLSRATALKVIMSLMAIHWPTWTVTCVG